MEPVLAAKTILVTGGSGFIGRPLVKQLLRNGYAVRVATRGSRAFPPAVDVAVIPDLAQPVDWAPILKDVDCVIHLAGLAHADVQGTELSTFDAVNWMATQKLAAAAKQARVERFVFVSSVRAQCGPSALQTVCEQDEPHPTDHYGRTKLAAEAALRASGVPFTILRPVAVYGPHPKGNIRTLVRLALLSLPLPLSGLDSRRSLLGIDNFISAILFVLNNPSTAGETFLVADPLPFTVREIITMLRAALGRRPGLFYVPPILLRLTLILLNRGQLWQRMSGDLVADTRKLQALGWRPTTDTYEGIVAMMRAEVADKAAAGKTD